MDEISKVDELLNEAMEKQLEELGKSNVGCEESKAIIEDFVELQKAALERKKLRVEEKKVENERKNEKRKAFWLGLLQIGGIAVQGVGIFMTYKSDLRMLRAKTAWLKGTLRYEKTGSISSLGGKTIASDTLRLKK